MAKVRKHTVRKLATFGDPLNVASKFQLHFEAGTKSGEVRDDSNNINTKSFLSQVGLLVRGRECV